MWVSPDKYKVAGGILEAARKKAGVTQTELAERLGKPQSFVSAYEAGQRRLDLLEFAIVADALGLDASKLSSQIFKSVGKNPSPK